MYTKMVNGVEVPLSGQEIQEFLDREKQHTDMINSVEYFQQTARRARREEYPAIGDQLDVVLKYFEAKEAEGEVLPQELKAVKDQWRATKNKYPMVKP